MKRETLYTNKKSRKTHSSNHFVQELSAVEEVSFSPIDGVVVAVVVVVLGVVTVAVGGVAVTARAVTVDVLFTVVNVVALVRSRAAPPAALGPARTANETG